MIFSKVWLINIVLAVVFFSIAIQAAEVWKQEDQFVLKAAAADHKVSVAKNRMMPKKEEPEGAYDLIAEKSLFSEDRTEYISEKNGAETDVLQTRKSRQPVFLYGVVMVGDYRKALIQENAGGSGKDRWVYEGDRVGGMTVKTIDKEKLSLLSDSETVEIHLHDRGKPKKAPSKMAETEAPTVVTLSSADSAPSPEIETQKSAAQEKSEKEHPKLNSDVKDKPETPLDDGLEKQTAMSVKENKRPPVSFPIAPNGKQNLTSSPGAGEYETIQTPFGKIQRKKIDK